MKIQDLLEELQEKQEYKQFKQEHNSSYFAAAFLILNLKEKTEEIQLDFFLPEQKEIAAFSYPFAKPKIHDQIISVKKEKTTPAKPTQMQKQTTGIKIDIDDLESKSKELIKENSSLVIPTKIIAILKNNTWNLTLMDDMLGIVRIKIDAISGELTEFNKGSLMDFMGIKKK